MAKKTKHYVAVEVEFDEPVLEREAVWSLRYAMEEYINRQKDYRNLSNRRIRIPSRPTMRIAAVKEFTRVAAAQRRKR